MKIVVADDEALALDDLIDNIKKIDDSFEIICPLLYNHKKVHI